jgi:hypothetical protein
MKPTMALAVAHKRAQIITFSGSLNPYITANPAIGVAVPVVLLSKPNMKINESSPARIVSPTIFESDFIIIQKNYNGMIC